jgi:hypothetical protein
MVYNNFEKSKGNTDKESDDIGQKFQYLYVSDFGFREQANKLLSLCYNSCGYNGMNLIQCKKILYKFIQ